MIRKKGSSKFSYLGTCVTAIFLAVLQMFSPCSVHAGDSITVSTTSDLVDGTTTSIAALIAAPGGDGKISLREAILAANNTAATPASPNIVNVPAGTYTLAAASGELKVGTSGTVAITIIGNGTAQDTVIQGDGQHRVFNLDPTIKGGVTVKIQNMTVKGGRDSSGFGGAGILAGYQGPTADATIIDNCIFLDNKVFGVATTSPGGAIAHGGGNLNVSNSIFDANDAGMSGGGAIWFDTFGLSATLTVSGSSFTNNIAGAGAADLGGALSITGVGAALNVSSSIFSGNQIGTSNTVGSGSGGAALFSLASPAFITTSQFTANKINSQVPVISPIFAELAGGAIYSSGTLTARYNRLAGNASIKPANGNAVFINPGSGTTTLNSNWWSVDAGPVINDVIGGSASPWLVLRNIASPVPIYVTESTTLIDDIYGTSNFGTVGGCPGPSCPLNGLPPFPSPAGIVFSNPLLGSLTGTATQFVNGQATATFVAGLEGGNGQADAVADSQITTANIPITSLADLSLTKSGAATAIPLNNLIYTITLTNNGPSSAANVTVSDTLPAGSTFVSASVAGGGGWIVSTPAIGVTGTVTFSKPSVPASESSIFQIVVKVSESVTNGAAISNTASVLTQTSDPVLENNASTSTSTVSYPVRSLLPGIAYYPTISSALTGVTSPNTLNVWGISFGEVLNFSLGKAITLKGGFDSGFVGNSAATSIVKGSLKINSGKLVVEKIKVKP